MCDCHDRKDDAFMRKIIWALLVVVLSSAGGWIWTLSSIQNQVDKNTRALKKQRLSRNLLIEIKTILNIVAADVGNLKTETARISREQATRTKTIVNTELHMRDRKLHK